ncbi:hypothetical protein CYMTET_33426 [Cymbomonas tetramitiformis]|uniref:Uncharacterized protein n=1 Tax=Cymbomonas tetramitiformis TaxID=36881 RepID=A0AAE0FDN0_9CHLO|nr:hypothetical protein CYMTET_46117 [Cymbomonas tetramitiformis]KAK3257488.1 hypothetical protein CYMTET_33426 [Cymbomonas tetramitiformis]
MLGQIEDGPLTHKETLFRVAETFNRTFGMYPMLSNRRGAAAVVGGHRQLARESGDVHRHEESSERGTAEGERVTSGSHKLEEGCKPGERRAMCGERQCRGAAVQTVRERGGKLRKDLTFHAKCVRLRPGKHTWRVVADFQWWKFFSVKAEAEDEKAE